MAKQTIYRRRRRILPAHEGKFFKKESGPENSFFGGSTHETFFQNQTINRKCDHCEQEEKEAHRTTDKKEDDKAVHRMEDKKDEKEVHRMEDKKEEKEVHRKAEAAGTPSVATASSYIASLNGKGGQLPPTARHFFQN